MIYKGFGVNKGAGVYNRAGVYNGVDVYKDGAAPVNTVKIGQNFYGVTEINGLLWITENLRERLDNVLLVYVNGDPNTEETEGLFYRAYDVFHYVVNILPAGWRLPSVNDFLTLRDGNNDRVVFDYVGTDWGGSDKDGLNLRRTGYRDIGNAYKWYGQYVSLWTSDAYSSNETRVFEGNPTNKISNNFDHSNGSPTTIANTCSCLRFCKDV